MPDTKTSDETAAGALDGTEIVRVSRGTGSPPTYVNRQTTAQTIANLKTLSLDGLSDVSVPAPSNGNVLTYQSGSPAGWVASAPAGGGGGGGGGGLYSQVLSALPTIASTGLSTWANQASATVSDGRTGVTLKGALAVNTISGRTKTAPSTPYNIDVLMDWATTVLPFGLVCGPSFGWYDGTKLQVMVMFINNSGIEKTDVINYATLSVSSGVTIFATEIPAPRMRWLRISDDGTTVSWYRIPGGDYDNPMLLYSVAKASGYLSNYNTIFFGLHRNGGDVTANLLSYTER